MCTWQDIIQNVAMHCLSLRGYLVVQQAALSEARSSEWMLAALRTISTQARPQSLHRKLSDQPAHSGSPSITYGRAGLLGWWLRDQPGAHQL